MARKISLTEQLVEAAIDALPEGEDLGEAIARQFPEITCGELVPILGRITKRKRAEAAAELDRECLADGLIPPSWCDVMARAVRPLGKNVPMDEAFALLRKQEKPSAIQCKAIKIFDEVVARGLELAVVDDE